MGEMADMIIDMAICYENYWNEPDEDFHELTCPYCGNIAGEVNGRIVYPHRPDLAHLKFFYCANGHDPAYVGTHKDSGIPLGTLANASLRSIRYQAHLAFDRLWKYNNKNANLEHMLINNFNSICVFQLKTAILVCLMKNNASKLLIGRIKLNLNLILLRMINNGTNISSSNFR